MADTLSQEEIDSLLRAVTKGEVSVEEIKKDEERAKVKSYDFRRPMKFSKDHTRTFQMIHENFARSLSTYLSGRLRFFVDVSLGPIEQITYGEFLKSVPNPTYMAIFTGSTLKGSAILEINQTIIFGMIDRILGGAGMSITKSRSLTEIETNIIRRETMRFLTLLRDAWASVMEFIPEIENIESNPQFVQIAPINDMTLLITLEVTIGTIEGFVNICIPTSVVEPFTEKITHQFWFSAAEKKEKEELTPKIARNLQNAPITLQAILGKTRLSVGELLYLQKGDVLRLDQYHDQKINIAIGDFPKFEGIPGTHRGKKAVKVTGVRHEITEDQEEEFDLSAWIPKKGE
ncbi:MAG TPA: flagellar motor switch protein FliM [Thermotogota bacterium]|jgi:flagellar motor switch protein FliM|nr:MAG: Flagellar motor switch protein FliM [Thermotogota bacterium ADurb.Bin062]HNW47140.1 flagellar motor switch protein FliM [Thermotogota bacterium]HOD91834.1 flagellar motor switch protein FliM [Thermotogota bacterium]HOF24303.1 flagellar motor switch protein FliM [Thermotogota bacterium]HOH12575.1 flagellar motor switch protein FliM [Thermotogota bacterium]